MTLQISSKDNPTFRNLKKLLTSKGIKEEKQFFIMGEKLINEFLTLKHSPFKAIKVITFDGAQALPLFDRSLILKKELFNEVDVLGTDYPLLVVEYRDFELAQLSTPPEGLEIIAPLGDPKNLGALVRSAVAFNASKIILTHESCHPYLPHSVKASAGAVLKIPIVLAQKKMNELPVSGANYALDLTGQPIQNVKWNKNARIWVGEEGPGLKVDDHQRNKMTFIHIPTDNVESLNATVSASIALWEINKTLSGNK